MRYIDFEWLIDRLIECFTPDTTGLIYEEAKFKIWMKYTLSLFYHNGATCDWRATNLFFFFSNTQYQYILCQTQSIYLKRPNSRQQIPVWSTNNTGLELLRRSILQIIGLAYIPLCKNDFLQHSRPKPLHCHKTIAHYNKHTLINKTSNISHVSLPDGGHKAKTGDLWSSFCGFARLGNRTHGSSCCTVATTFHFDVRRNYLQTSDFASRKNKVKTRKCIKVEV